MITYLKGDATAPQATGNKIIAHICNDIGGWGKGFVLALSKKWSAPAQAYRDWYASKRDFELGNMQLVQVEPDIFVANIIGQHNIYKDEKGNPPIRYQAIEAGLEKLSHLALAHKASIHMPRIGCGLAGGTWDKIEPIIKSTLLDKNIAVYVYDF